MSLPCRPKGRWRVFLYCVLVMCILVVLVLVFSKRSVQREWQLLDSNDELLRAIQNQARKSKDSVIASSELVQWLARHLDSDLPEITAEDVVFLVMASMQEKHRVACQRSSWMKWAKHVLVFADANDSELDMMTLPEIENKTGFAEAQFRQLHGMKWVQRERPDLMGKKWFFLVDDDTWVNVPHLFTYLSSFPANLPLSFSHLYVMYDRQAVYNGGAGMLFAQKAFHTLASALLTEACPLSQVDPAFVNNDNILAACAYSTGVIKVTSSRFSTYEGDLRIQGDIIDTAWLDQITVHKIRDCSLARQLSCWTDSLHLDQAGSSCGLQ